MKRSNSTITAGHFQESDSMDSMVGSIGLTKRRQASRAFSNATISRTDLARKWATEQKRKKDP